MKNISQKNQEQMGRNMDVCTLNVLMKAKEMMDSKEMPFDVVPYLMPAQKAILSDLPENPKKTQRHDWWNQGRRY